MESPKKEYSQFPSRRYVQSLTSLSGLDIDIYSHDFNSSSYENIINPIKNTMAPQIDLKAKRSAGVILP